jgi:hypothetical protein
MKRLYVITGVICVVSIAGAAWGIDEFYGSSRTERTTRSDRTDREDRTIRTDRTTRPAREYELENVPDTVEQEPCEKEQTDPVEE